MSQEDKQPNIIFVLSDQQRWDTVGCYGQKLPVTPNLDKMASEGVKFEYAFTCQPVCGPARACLQTGKYPTQTGCFRNGIALPTDERTIAHILSENGYEVGYIGKWHLASNRFMGDLDLDFTQQAVPPERRGGYKDYWLASDILEFTSHSYDGHMFNADMEKVSFPEGRYRADVQTDWVIDYLQTYKNQKPFFLFVSYVEPHHQNDHDHYEGPLGSKEKFSSFEIPGDLKGTEGNWKLEYPDYLGCINSLDKNIGRIRSQLKKLQLEENTLVIYTSDHGSHFRTRNSEYKRSCHESSIRIPMIFYGPDYKGGKTISELVSLIDIPPTILTCAKAQVPDTMKGKSLGQLVDGRVDWPQEVFVQISESQVGRAIRTKEWKYAVSAPNKDGGKDPCSDIYIEEYLYNLQVDPFERNNLVREENYSAIRTEMANRLIKMICYAGEKEPKIISPSPI